MRQSVSKLLTGVLSGSSSRMQLRAEKQGENGAEYKKDVMFHTDGGFEDKRAVLRLFTFDEAEMFHVAYHETMVPDMAAQSVYTALADVAQIAGPERKSCNGKVQCQEMAHGRRIARISKNIRCGHSCLMTSHSKTVRSVGENMAPMSGRRGLVAGGEGVLCGYGTGRRPSGMRLCRCQPWLVPDCWNYGCCKSLPVRHGLLLRPSAATVCPRPSCNANRWNNLSCPPVRRSFRPGWRYNKKSVEDALCRDASV